MIPKPRVSISQIMKKTISVRANFFPSNHKRTLKNLFLLLLAENTFEKPNVHSTPISNVKPDLRYHSHSAESKSFHKETVRRSSDDERYKLQLDRSSGVRALSPYRSKFMLPQSEIKVKPKIIPQKPPLAPQSDSSRRRHRRSRTMPDLRRTALYKTSRTFGRSFDDDLLSHTTDDTESLVTKPSMPLMDVSPSLTTVSDSDTMVGSETETENEGYTSKRSARSQIKSGLGLSPTSVFASSNANAAVREQPPGNYRLWEM